MNAEIFADRVIEKFKALENHPGPVDPDVDEEGYFRALIRNILIDEFKTAVAEMPPVVKYIEAGGPLC